jgi:hypothetical protein
MRNFSKRLYRPNNAFYHIYLFLIHIDRLIFHLCYPFMKTLAENALIYHIDSAHKRTYIMPLSAR